MDDNQKQERRRKLVKKLRTPVQAPLENPELDNPEGDMDLPPMEESFGAPDEGDEMDALYGGEQPGTPMTPVDGEPEGDESSVQDIDEETPATQPTPITGTASAKQEQDALVASAPRRKKKRPLSDRTV
jgi:hypothetical protein